MTFVPKPPENSKLYVGNNKVYLIDARLASILWRQKLEFTT